MISASTLSDRRGLWAFIVGVIAVTVGVLLHVPMFLMGEMTHYRLYGMPMGADMIVGMAPIILGVAIAAYGLLPRNIAKQLAASQDIVVSPPEDAPLSSAHWTLMAVLVIALIIDIMKPASLGFTIPGMVSEYGVPKATASLVPFFALTGTVVGSIVWGIIADIYGRKASILLSAVMFVGTSICGAMPSLAWNIGMCFMMGAAAGGMLPVTYALLAEMMPSKHRGWSARAGRWSGRGRRLFRCQRLLGACCSRLSAGGSSGCSTCRRACRWSCSVRSFLNPPSSCLHAAVVKRLGASWNVSGRRPGRRGLRKPSHWPGALRSRSPDAPSSASWSRLASRPSATA